MTQEEKTEFNFLMGRFKDTLVGFALATIIFLLFSLFNCNGERPALVNKEVKGTFKSDKVKNEPIEKNSLTENLPVRQKLSKNDKSKNYNVQYSTQNDSLISELLAENEKLSRDYYLQSDSIKRGLYEKAIQLNKFSQSFDDENVKIDVSGIARGTVQSIKANYNIKKQPIKERVFALKTGVEYGNTTTLNNSVFKGNLEFENRKGNSYNIGYDTDKRYWLGAKFTIFQIKR